MMRRKIGLWLLALACVLAVPLYSMAQWAYQAANFGALDGSPTAPSFGFVNNTNRGIYNDVGNSGIGFTVGGSQQANLNASGLSLGANASRVSAMKHGLCVISPPTSLGIFLEQYGQTPCVVGQQLTGNERLVWSISEVGLGIAGLVPTTYALTTVSASASDLSTQKGISFYFKCASSTACPANTATKNINWIAFSP